MKKLSLFFIGLLFVPVMFLTSCDRGDDPQDNSAVATPKFTLMKEYMVQNSRDVNNILTNPDGEKFVVGAPADADLNTFLNTYHIVDIRSEATFNAGHIESAVNRTLGQLLDEAASATKPMLIVCYTGQTACYATALLRLYGYSHTKALKWGMSGWNPATAGSWNSNIGDIAQNSVNWTYSAAPSNTTYSDPEPQFTINSSDGEALLKNRVETVLADGLKGVNGSDVLENPGNYFVNNYFSEADYSGFGHIANAYRINPFTLSDGTYKNLDPDRKVVTYCYTGQTSAVLSATLNVLGYDAYSLKFGMNGLYNSNPAWTTNQWGGDSNPKNLPLIVEN